MTELPDPREVAKDIMAILKPDVLDAEEVRMQVGDAIAQTLAWAEEMITDNPWRGSPDKLYEAVGDAIGGYFSDRIAAARERLTDPPHRPKEE